MRTSSCNCPTTPTIPPLPHPLRSDIGEEDLSDPFLCQVRQGLAQLLGLGRVFERDTAEDFRGEIGEASDGGLCAFGQGIAHPQRAVVGDANDVAGESFIRNFAFAGEKEDGVGKVAKLVGKSVANWDSVAGTRVRYGRDEQGL